MNKKAIASVANSVRALSMDMIQKAKSGHPGLPMGCAELGAVIFGEVLKHNPKDSKWIDRDRFVLSAGHGSALLYSLLHLCGYGVSLDDIKNFRQLGSNTPGHPEYGMTDGVETTTGPLGAGFTNAVGMAIAEAMLAEKFNTKQHKIIDHYTYVLSGDGCMMEGLTSEAASLAGNLGLGKLIVFYDDNGITIEGSTKLAFTEDVKARFASYNWQVLSGDAYDVEGILKLVAQAKKDTKHPTLISLKSVIGKGSPNLAGTHKVHGAPLGEDEVKAAKKALGIPEKDFYIFPEAKEYFKEKAKGWKKDYDSWTKTFEAWKKANPELVKEWCAFMVNGTFEDIKLPKFNVGDKIATRSASGKTLVSLCAAFPNLVGGSADLAPSNNTVVPDNGDFSKENRKGRTLHFGIREHAMGGIANGLILHGGFRSYCATFMSFADYLRPTVRLAAIMKIPTIFILTHDSIYVGEDGPTHQPVEQLESLRVIPNTQVIRPGDAQETEIAWLMALGSQDNPTCMAFTRQNITVYLKDDKQWKKNMLKGAYIVKDCKGTPDVVVVATGSEVSLAVEAAAKTRKKVRVVSMPCRELFESQSAAYRNKILPKGVRVVVAECGVPTGWKGYAKDEDILAVKTFGESGKYADVAAKFGFTADNLAKIIKRK
ncbi:MAG: transketolase [Spirochaetia bacterium]|nr:transketolase [Spirochaetia bacterium]